MKQLEVELRGVLNEKDFKRVGQCLQIADHKEEDNKLTYFFVTEGFILKVTDEESKNKAKITVKVGDETKNILQEYEIEIDRKSVVDSVSILRALGFDKVNPVNQKRINYSYKNAEIALKYTPDWGYHFEVEKIVNDIDEVDAARSELEDLCRELSIIPMTPAEIRTKITEINTLHGFIK